MLLNGIYTSTNSCSSSPESGKSKAPYHMTNPQTPNSVLTLGEKGPRQGSLPPPHHQLSSKQQHIRTAFRDTRSLMKNLVSLCWGATFYIHPRRCLITMIRCCKKTLLVYLNFRIIRINEALWQHVLIHSFSVVNVHAWNTCCGNSLSRGI